jgi:hypothetical protein
MNRQWHWMINILIFLSNKIILSLCPTLHLFGINCIYLRDVVFLWVCNFHCRATELHFLRYLFIFLRSCIFGCSLFGKKLSSSYCLELSISKNIFNFHLILHSLVKTRVKGSNGTLVFEFQWIPISGQDNLKWHFLYQNQGVMLCFSIADFNDTDFFMPIFWF